MALAAWKDLEALLITTAQPVPSEATLRRLIDAATAGVESYCHRKFESEERTEFLDGNGLPDLPLRQRPVSTVASVYLDAGGYYGQGIGAFPANSLLTVGTDYALVKDASDDGATSKSGILKRIGGLMGGGAFMDWPGSYGLRRGTLTARRAPSWPNGQGNIKVTYTAGYAATAIPADLTQATIQLAAEMYRHPAFGRLWPSGESLGEYSYSMAVQVLKGMAETVRILAAYREFTV